MRITHCAQCGIKFRSRIGAGYNHRLVYRAVTLPKCRDDSRCWVSKQVQSDLAKRCREHAKRTVFTEVINLQYSLLTKIKRSD